MQSTCTFADGAKIKHVRYANQPEDIRARLQRLEGLVSSMAQTSSSPGMLHTPESPPDGQVPDTPEPRIPTAGLDTRAATLSKNSQGQRFVGSSNWEAVLQDLSVIREHFEEASEIQANAPISSSEPALLSGLSSDVTLAELVGDLPRREFADQLISRFFDTYDPAVPSRQLLHKPSFMKMYKSFWFGLEHIDVSTLSKLFSVFCLAMQSYDRQDDEPLYLRGMTIKLAESYRKRAAQCLLKSGISTATREHLEAFLMYGIIEYARAGNEAVVGQWFVLGMMVRKAFHMGYHRDPDAFPELSPYEKEMRRRLWAHVWQIDTLYSFSLGLPSSVSKSKSNVAPPRNLFDEELYEDMVELPPSQHAEVMTPISFTRAKINLMQGLVAVMEHMNSIEEHTYTQVMDMNKQLAAAHDMVPSFLRIKSWAESASDPKSLRLQRLQLRMFYDKSVCTLNRTLLNVPAAMCSECIQPRKMCIESALSLLRIQVGYHRERNKWFRFHLSRHDFLLAAVILFIVLGNKRRSRHDATNNAYDAEDFELIRALHQSREIWADHTSQSSDARTACRMFDRMKDKFQLPSADMLMSMMSYASAPANSADVNSINADVGADTSMMILGTETLSFNPDQYADFDWNAWETAFDNSHMNERLDDLTSFWTIDGNTTAP
jgi:hypothetical protein